MKGGVTSPAAVIRVAPHVRLSLVKERHVRRDRAYLVEDKATRVLYLAQKLAPLITVLNAAVEHCADRITISGVFQNMSSAGERNGGYAKHRFRCVAVTIGQAAEAFDRMRGEGFRECYVVGDPTCYRLS